MAEPVKCVGVEVQEAAKTVEPRGLLFTLTPWKAALLGPFVDFVGLAAMIPLIPFFVADAGADEVWIGAIMSAQYFGVCVGSVFWGYVADHFGVRKVYLVLLLLDVFFFALSSMMTNIVSLFVVRTLAGFCAIMPLGSAWISATAPPERMMQAFTYLVASILLGFIIGSAMGGAAGQIKTGIGMGDGGWFAGLMSSALLCLVVFFVILLGTAPPPKVAKAESPKTKKEGLVSAMANVKFFACCVTAFLGANEGGMFLVITTSLLTSASPDGFGYDSSLMGLVWVGIATVILLSSLFFTDWLGKRSHPLQRIVLLGTACTCIISIMGLVMLSWDLNGLMAHGDKVYIGLKCALLVFQCCVGPTAMAIAAGCAAAHPECNATIMGVQQMFLSVGQAVGPIVGALLLKVGLFAPFAYVVSFEALVLALNVYVFVRARRCDELDGRSLCNLRSIILASVDPEPRQPEEKVDHAEPQIQTQVATAAPPVLLDTSAEKPIGDTIASV